MAEASKTPEEIVRLRDEILLKCIENDIDCANDLVVKLENIVQNLDENEYVVRESTCRLWETKLDVAEISEDASIKLVAVMNVINKLPEFTEIRRSEIIERGLRMLSRVLK